MDTDPDSYLHPMMLGKVDIEGLHGCHHPQAGLHRPLYVVLMSLRIAKIDQQAVTEILRNIPLKALNHLGTGGLIRPDHLPEVFRIKLTGERGGVYEVAEHDSKLATFRIGKIWSVD